MFRNQNIQLNFQAFRAFVSRDYNETREIRCKINVHDFTVLRRSFSFVYPRASNITSYDIKYWPVSSKKKTFYTNVSEHEYKREV